MTQQVFLLMHTHVLPGEYEKMMTLTKRALTNFAPALV